MDDMFDAIFKSMNCLGVLIADGQGMVTQVEDQFDEFYGVRSSELVSRSVYELEKEGVFKPSVVAMVLEKRQEVTLVQRVKSGQDVIVTAFPIFGTNGEIAKVITFSRDMSSFNRLKNMYEDLTKKIDHYNRTLDELSYETAIIEEFHTNNSTFKQTLKNIQRLAKYDINILIEGETGVGKSLISKKIHQLSSNAKGRFVEINCGAMPDHLIESELFGYEKGAFTGADRNGKLGLFEVAGGGTLFLDEISEMPLSSQVKLLKVLQDKEFRRIGGTKDIKASCRILSATNKNLQEEVAAGRFRQDLLYRLNAVSINIPPLRERKEDIITLSKSILDKANNKYGFNKVFDGTVLSTLTRYGWPGNTRELENVIYKMVIASENDVITKEMLPDSIAESNAIINQDKRELFFGEIDDLTKAMEEYESYIIRNVYKKENSSIKLAKALNISQTTAARKLRKYKKT